MRYDSEKDKLKCGNMVTKIVPVFEVLSDVPKFLHWYLLNKFSRKERILFIDYPFLPWWVNTVRIAPKWIWVKSWLLHYCGKSFGICRVINYSVGVVTKYWSSFDASMYSFTPFMLFWCNESIYINGLHCFWHRQNMDLA